MKQLMIDLETLSTEDDAVVLAIGAVIFDEEKVLDSKGWQLRFDNMSGHIDPETVRWWMDQSKEAQQVTFGGERVPAFVAAHELKGMIDKHQPTTFWANDPHFDYVILRNWWHRNQRATQDKGTMMQPGIGYAWPFKYNQPRSYRTMVELAEQHGFTPEMRGQAKGMYVAHSAVEDAAAQARVIIAIKAYLQSGGSSHQLVAPIIERARGSWVPQADGVTVPSVR